MEKYNIKKSATWHNNESPMFSIITPVYNRQNTILRTIESVENQTFKDFEYIIVNDGSEDCSEQILNDYVSKTSYQVMCINKVNGGVHTARNTAINFARGKYLVNIDSDDELNPLTLELGKKYWEYLKDLKVFDEYFEVVGLCSDDFGKIVGDKFLISSDIKDHHIYKSNMKNNGEHIGVRRLDILKSNMWPEPREVRFVTEDILWKSLRNQYKTFFVNDVFRIYHTEANDRLSVRKKKTIQSCKNSIWDAAYRLNRKDVYINGITDYFENLLRFGVFSKILCDNNENAFVDSCRLMNKVDKYVCFLLFCPIKMMASVFVKKRM